MREFCDKCSGKIENERCPCGIWKKDHLPDFFEDLKCVVLQFKDEVESGRLDKIFTGDHHNGYCVALFKGDFKLCQKLKEFLNKEYE